MEKDDSLLGMHRDHFPARLNVKLELVDLSSEVVSHATGPARRGSRIY